MSSLRCKQMSVLQLWDDVDQEAQPIECSALSGFSAPLCIVIDAKLSCEKMASSPSVAVASLVVAARDCKLWLLEVLWGLLLIVMSIGENPAGDICMHKLFFVGILI